MALQKVRIPISFKGLRTAMIHQYPSPRGFNLRINLFSVFFKPGKFAAFDQMMQADPAQLKVLIQAVEKWLIRARWRYAQYSHLMVIKLAKKIEWKREMYTTIQAYWRKCFPHQT